jgi:hypothetical protein
VYYIDRSISTLVLCLLQGTIIDPNYFFVLLIIYRLYEDQVDSPYGGEQVLSQGI